MGYLLSPLDVLIFANLKNCLRHSYEELLETMRFYKGRLSWKSLSFQNLVYILKNQIPSESIRKSFILSYLPIDNKDIPTPIAEKINRNKLLIRKNNENNDIIETAMDFLNEENNENIQIQDSDEIIIDYNKIPFTILHHSKWRPGLYEKYLEVIDMLEEDYGNFLQNVERSKNKIEYEPIKAIPEYYINKLKQDKKDSESRTKANVSIAVIKANNQTDNEIFKDLIHNGNFEINLFERFTKDDFIAYLYFHKFKEDSNNLPKNALKERAIKVKHTRDSISKCFGIFNSIDRNLGTMIYDFVYNIFKIIYDLGTEQLNSIIIDSPYMNSDTINLFFSIIAKIKKPNNFFIENNLEFLDSFLLPSYITYKNTQNNLENLENSSMSLELKDISQVSTLKDESFSSTNLKFDSKIKIEESEIKSDDIHDLSCFQLNNSFSSLDFNEEDDVQLISCNTNYEKIISNFKEKYSDKLEIYRQRNKSSKITINIYPKIVIPVFIENETTDNHLMKKNIGHWTCFIANLNSKTIEVYDSYPNNYNVDKYIEILKDWIGYEFEELKNLITYKKMSWPHQGETTICGWFTILASFLRFEVNNHSITDMILCIREEIEKLAKIFLEFSNITSSSSIEIINSNKRKRESSNTLERRKKTDNGLKKIIKIEDEDNLHLEEEIKDDINEFNKDLKEKDNHSKDIKIESKNDSNIQPNIEIQPLIESQVKFTKLKNPKLKKIKFIDFNINLKKNTKF